MKKQNKNYFKNLNKRIQLEKGFEYFASTVYKDEYLD